MWLIDDWDHLSIDPSLITMDNFNEIITEIKNVLLMLEYPTIRCSFFVGTSPELMDLLGCSWISQTMDNISEARNGYTILGMTEDHVTNLLSINHTNKDKIDEVLKYCKRNYSGYQYSQKEKSRFNTPYVISALNHYYRRGNLQNIQLSHTPATPKSAIEKYLNLKDNWKFTNIVFRYLYAFRTESVVYANLVNHVQEYMKLLIDTDFKRDELLSLCTTIWSYFGHVVFSVLFSNRFKIPNEFEFKQFLELWSEQCHVPSDLSNQVTQDLNCGNLESLFNYLISEISIKHHQFDMYRVIGLDLMLYSMLRRNYSYEVQYRVDSVNCVSSDMEVLITNNQTGYSIMLDLNYISISDLIIQYNFFDNIDKRIETMSAAFEAKSLEQKLNIRFTHTFRAKRTKFNNSVELYQTLSDYLCDAEIHFYTNYSKLHILPDKAAIYCMIGKDCYLIRYFNGELSQDAKLFLRKNMEHYKLKYAQDYNIQKLLQVYWN
jgi:hypothetical protein